MTLQYLLQTVIQSDGSIIKLHEGKIIVSAANLLPSVERIPWLHISLEKEPGGWPIMTLLFTVRIEDKNYN